MDVRCEKCQTEYELDESRLKPGGVTVKCTNCGHQFKVRRAEPAGAPERWLVRTIDGRELEFRALRELQAAIAQAIQPMIGIEQNTAPTTLTAMSRRSVSGTHFAPPAAMR